MLPLRDCQNPGMTERSAMTSKLARLAAAMLIALCCSFAGASAEDGMIWTQKSNGDLTTLSYGPVDPGAPPLFMLSCFSALDIAVLDVHREVAGAKAGDKVSIELSSSKGQASVSGDVSTDDATGKTFGEASEVKLQPVLDLLRAPGSISLKMGDASFSLSEQGRDLAVGEFSKNCDVK